MAVPPVPWYRIFGQLIGIINVLFFIVIIIGLIFSFIAIWRMMKAHEDLASAVKEISIVKEKVERALYWLRSSKRKCRYMGTFLLCHYFQWYLSGRSSKSLI
ncbi:MAG: hypothetical protein PHT79_12245 [Syntrophomonadaceae bacterium]|nr:hypothetical protein [Fermentimonas sp.]MDD3890462.1 hypothetical protein [Syntrophomonadaceae bacterium]MDD4550514.1 hypothetical protein [Syntrophomonadaceae bacterium]